VAGLEAELADFVAMRAYSVFVSISFVLLTSQVADAAMVSIRGSLTGQVVKNQQVPEGEVAGVSYTNIAIGATVVLLVVGAVVAAMVMGKKKADGSAETENASGETQGLMAAEGKDEDIATMLKGLAQKVAEDVGPKLSKDGSVRKVLQDRAGNFTERAKNFVLKEMNDTAGAVLSEIEKEEGRLMLEWNDAVETNFPPLSILIAGLMSPTTLQLMMSHHSSQALTVGLPMFGLCIAALVVDWEARCDSIPTIWAWLYTTTVLSACMFFGHTFLFFKVLSGKKELDAKTVEVKERISHTAKGSMSNTKEQVIGNMVLVQEALIIENGIRHSFWNIIVGVATILWLFTTIWDLVLVVGWTFVPGQIAFHPKAAGLTGGEFCGAWMTVLVLKVFMLLGVLYFFLNIATIVQFVCDMMIGSSSFADTVLGTARDLDKNGVGVPVTELLAKAFLLRGGDDMLASRLAVATHHRKCLQQEKEDLLQKLGDVTQRAEFLQSETDALAKTVAESGGGDLAAQCAKLKDDNFDFEAWKAKGKESIEVAEKAGEEISAASTEQLEIVQQKIMEAADALKNSETFKALMDMEAYMEAKALELKAKLEDPAFQAELMAELNQLKEYAQEATNKAKELADQAIKELEDPENFKMLQDYANKALEEAKAAGQKISDAVNDPELQKMLQDEAEKAYEKAKEAAHAAAEVVQDPKLQQQLKDASMQAMNTAKKAALDTAASVKAAAEDPELQAKLKAQLRQ
jgi:hypothetical protein